MFKFETGVKVRDRITKLSGIVVARGEWVNGCLRYLIQPSVSKDKPSEYPEGWWLDERSLELVDKGINDKPIKKVNTGGPAERAQRF